MRRSPHTSLPRASAAILFAAALVSCAVGPDYEEPELPTPDVWQQELARGLETGDASIAQWWTVLEDPTLEQLITRASAGNLDLRQAAARIAQASGQRGIAVGEWFPTIDSETLYSRAQTSEELLGGLPVDNPGDLYQTGVAANWEVDLFGRIRRSVESAEADLETSIEDYRDVLVVLYAEVATAYLDVRAFQERVRLAQQNVDSQRETLDLVAVRNRVGLVGDLDLRQAEVNVARTASVIPSLREQQIAAQNRLAVLLGMYPQDVAGLIATPARVPLPDVRLAVGLPADLVRQRPDLRRAERELASQTARIGVATADLYPRLSLLGSIGLDARTAARWMTGDALAWSIGPSIRWNLFDGGAIRSNVRLQEALSQELLARYEEAVLLAVEDVENALASYTQEYARLEELRKSSDAATRTVELVQVLYRTGLVDFLNVLDAERAQFEEQDARAESRGRVAKNLVSIYRALGGGWTP